MSGRVYDIAVQKVQPGDGLSSLPESNTVYIVGGAGIVSDSLGTRVDVGWSPTWTGTHAFSDYFPTTPSSAPTTDYQVANRKFVLDRIALVSTSVTTLSDNVGVHLPLIPAGFGKRALSGADVVIDRLTTTNCELILSETSLNFGGSPLSVHLLQDDDSAGGSLEISSKGFLGFYADTGYYYFRSPSGSSFVVLISGDLDSPTDFSALLFGYDVFGAGHQLDLIGFSHNISVNGTTFAYPSGEIYTTRVYVNNTGYVGSSFAGITATLPNYGVDGLCAYGRDGTTSTHGYSATYTDLTPYASGFSGTVTGYSAVYGNNLVSNQEWMAPFWYSSNAALLGGVRLKVYRVGSPGTVNVKLVASDPVTGAPVMGTVYATGSFNGNSVTTDTAGEIVNVDFSDAWSFSSNTYCHVVLQASSGDASNYLAWIDYTRAKTYYTDPGEFTSSDGGSTWSLFGASSNWGAYRFTWGQWLLPQLYVRREWDSDQRMAMFRIDLIDTSSRSDSCLADWSVDDVTVFRVDKSGKVYGTDGGSLQSIPTEQGQFAAQFLMMGG